MYQKSTQAKKQDTISDLYHLDDQHEQDYSIIPYQHYYPNHILTFVVPPPASYDIEMYPQAPAPDKPRRPKKKTDDHFNNETEEEKKHLFDATLTGFVLKLFENHQHVPLSEGYIVEQVRANLSKLKRPDGTRYKGNLYKTVKGSLTSNGIFRVQSKHDNETQWVVCQKEAEEFEKRTLQRFDHGDRRRMNKKVRIEEHTETIQHKHSHVYRLLNGFLESQANSHLRELLDQLSDSDIDKHKAQLKDYNIELVKLGMKECYDFFKDTVKSKKKEQESI